MQLASLIVAAASLAVSTTTLVIIIVGAKKGQQIAAEAVQTAENLKQNFKDAVANL